MLECEYDPDHLYHDHREADELRADVELLTRNRDAARMIIGPLSERPDLVDACEDVVREADELRAEIERLRTEIVTWGQIWNDEPLLSARAEALRDGTADLGRPKSVSSDKPLRVLVTGDRNWRDMAMVFRVLSEYGPDTILIHGAARGADRHADAYGHNRGWQVFAEPADWDLHGRAAGPIRNQRMLDEHRPDVCHAFHDDLEHSKGTKDMVARCDKAGVPVHVHSHS